MERIAINAGASVTKSITNKTTILVIANANSMSAKARKARENGIDLISPEQFFEMCNPVTTINIGLERITSPNQFSIEKPKLNKDKRHSLVRKIEL